MPGRTQDSFDVLVVGSGASGGWAAKRLAEAGVKVALVDAGRPQSLSNFTEHEPVFSLPYRDQAAELMRRTRPRQKDCYACMEWNYDWFCNDLEEPYSTPDGKPFTWQGRLRITGGRTNVWGRQSYRLSDLDFKAASFDGYGEDWPLSYADLAPYYDVVEDYVGISGQAEGVYELPDGRFQPPMAMTCAEVALRERVKKAMGRTITIGRTANLTRGLNGRAACHYCGPCERGCITRSYFNSAFTTVADALATGNCAHIPNAMVYKVLTDADRGHARGVLYVDRETHEAKEVEGRVVVLCAQALESARILLNSATRQHPQGLGNSSGVLGHYLMDHCTGGGASGELDELHERPSLGSPSRPNGLYAIRFRNTKGGPRHQAFLRGYGMQGDGGTGWDFQAPGFGQAWKKAITRPVTRLSLGGFGESLARFENRVEIDPSGQVDVYGIPILNIHMSHGENERAMVKDMAEQAAEMIEAAGGKNVQVQARVDTPGNAIHEVGIARMGKDPKTSVLTQFQQSHDVPNLFVMDGSGFVSSACQNPTLTIMALTVRSTDYLLTEMRRGNL